MDTKLHSIMHVQVNYHLDVLQGGGHANFDADVFVPMDSLGDA